MAVRPKHLAVRLQCLLNANLVQIYCPEAIVLRASQGLYCPEMNVLRASHGSFCPKTMVLRALLGLCTMGFLATCNAGCEGRGRMATLPAQHH